MANENALEPMQIDLPPDEVDRSNIHFVNRPILDVEAYANSYTGIARLQRLEFIAERCPPLRIEALKMALQDIMKTSNIIMYQQLHRKLAEAVSTSTVPVPDVVSRRRNGNIEILIDKEWIDQKSKKSALKLEKLDGDLKTSRANSLKESIRRGHDDLGDHYMECGDLENALKCYSRSRSYCTNGKHVINLCLNVIKVNIYLKNWKHVGGYVMKAEAVPEYMEPRESNFNLICRLKCAAGLAELASGRYKVAAKSFLQANIDYCDFTDLLAPNNIAIYGGLCALATFDRSDLQKDVILSSTFKLFLELEPQLRDIIYKFYDSKYASCLTLLEEIRDSLYLDIYLAPHVDALYSQIRKGALIQYFSPYVSADMRKMASAFNTTVTALEEEVINLILEDEINARIDSHNKVLYAKDDDQRNTTYARSIIIGKHYIRSAHMMILRSAMTTRHIQVKAEQTLQIGTTCLTPLITRALNTAKYLTFSGIEGI